jgi:hypothetical protein
MLPAGPVITHAQPAPATSLSLVCRWRVVVDLAQGPSGLSQVA